MSMTPQPMETAPKDGGWVLGLVRPDGPTETHWQPWEPVTYGDGGWFADNGDESKPVAWVALPDPQPRNTGYRPPEGAIRVEEDTGNGWTDGRGNPINVPYRWLVCVERPDGSYDEYRDTDYRETREQAEASAARLAATTGLPIVVVPLPAQPSNVVSISVAKLPASEEGDEHG